MAPGYSDHEMETSVELEVKVSVVMVSWRLLVALSRARHWALRSGFASKAPHSTSTALVSTLSSPLHDITRLRPRLMSVGMLMNLTKYYLTSDRGKNGIGLIWYNVSSKALYVENWWVDVFCR